MFDLKSDLSEQHNLSKSMPTKATALVNRLHNWRQAVGALMPTPNPDYTPEKIRRTGMLGHGTVPVSYMSFPSPSER